MERLRAFGLIEGKNAVMVRIENLLKTEQTISYSCWLGAITPAGAHFC